CRTFIDSPPPNGGQRIMDAATQTLATFTLSRAPAAATSDPRAVARCAWRVLEEIDYGLILLSATGELQHANQLGWSELTRTRFLRVDDGVVIGETAAVTQELRRGLQAAALGRRHM